MKTPAILCAVVGLVLFTACSPKKAPGPQVSGDRATTPVVASAAVATAATAALPVIGPAPSWSLKDLDGNVVRSEDFKGKVVVVDFWATWCPPCRAEIPGYIQLAKKYEKDVAIIGVSLDEAGAQVVKDFAKKFGVNYPMVMGNAEVVAAFGSMEAIPTTFLIDRSGQIRDRKVGAVAAEEYEKRIASLLN